MDFSHLVGRRPVSEGWKGKKKKATSGSKKVKRRKDKPRTKIKSVGWILHKNSHTHFCLSPSLERTPTYSRVVGGGCEEELIEIVALIIFQIYFISVIFLFVVCRNIIAVVFRITPMFSAFSSIYMFSAQNCGCTFRVPGVTC